MRALTPKDWRFIIPPVKARALAGWFLLAACSWAAGAEDIKIPFNFQWGESAQRLEKALESVKARVVERKTDRGRQVLVVEGIPQKLLQRALFYFDSDSLSEIELQYGDPAWDSARSSAFFDQTRRNIEEKYGIGRVIARQKTREGDVLQTLIGYQWKQPVTTLSLFYYTAERGADSFRLLSLHYRGF
ncbi:MAG: hypothetical protein N2322_02945 [Terrimicrobiaceae bacterium]|nr:hypothetical protein [Terrimicrobiaceae bacterium]